MSSQRVPWWSQLINFWQYSQDINFLYWCLVKKEKTEIFFVHFCWSATSEAESEIFSCWRLAMALGELARSLGTTSQRTGYGVNRSETWSNLLKLSAVSYIGKCDHMNPLVSRSQTCHFIRRLSQSLGRPSEGAEPKEPQSLIFFCLSNSPSSTYPLYIQYFR